jgi:hypothetical protein
VMGVLANTGTCKICHGSGSLVAFGASVAIEYWTCPACGGAGTRALFSPPSFNRRVVIGKHGRELAA